MHSINENWKLEARLLQCAYLPGSHTTDLLGESLMECICEWGLTKTANISDVFGALMPHISAMVRPMDNCSNIVKACANLKANRIPCFDYCLNIAVNKELADDKMSGAVGAVCKLCSHFSHSTRQSGRVEKSSRSDELTKKKSEKLLYYRVR